MKNEKLEIPEENLNKQIK